MKRRTLLTCSGAIGATFISGCIADDTTDLGDALPIGGDDCSEEWDCIGDEFLDWDEDDYPPVRTECAPEFYDEEDSQDEQIYFIDHPLEDEDVRARVDEYNQSKDPTDKFVDKNLILQGHESVDSSLIFFVLGERYTHTHERSGRTRHGFMATTCEKEAFEHTADHVRSWPLPQGWIMVQQAESDEKVIQAAALPFVVTVDLTSGGDDG